MMDSRCLNIQESKYIQVDLSTPMLGSDFFVTASRLLRARNYTGLVTHLSQIDSEESDKPENKQKNAYKKYFDKKNMTKRKIKEKQELLALYCSQHKCQNFLVHFLGWLGVAGELFYLYWDFRGREDVTQFFIPSADNEIFSGLSWNRLINALITVPVGLANITYWPPKSARDFMENEMLGKKLLTKVTDNRKLSICFLIYSLGGSYIEAERFYGQWSLSGFIPFLFSILVSGTAYYFLYNYNDAVEGCTELSKGGGYPDFFGEEKTFCCNNKMEERIARYLGYFHKFIVTISRSVRIGYGGYDALEQMSGSKIAGYSAATAVGLATLPVALGTRAMSTHNLYYPSSKDFHLPEFYQRYSEVKKDYEDNEKLSILTKLQNELRLFFSPALFLQIPLGYCMGQLFSLGFEDNSSAQTIAKCVSGTGTMLLSQGLFRYQAKQKVLIERTKLKYQKDEDKKEEDQKANGESKKQALTENGWTRSAKISYVCNFFDQGSRLMTMLYMLNKMASWIFNTDTFEGQRAMILVAFVELFIAGAAYRYQSNKCIETYDDLGESLSAVCGSSSGNSNTTIEDAENNADYDIVPQVSGRI